MSTQALPRPAKTTIVTLQLYVCNLQEKAGYFRKMIFHSYPIREIHKTSAPPCSKQAFLRSAPDAPLSRCARTRSRKLPKSTFEVDSREVCIACCCCDAGGERGILDRTGELSQAEISVSVQSNDCDFAAAKFSLPPPGGRLVSAQRSGESRGDPRRTTFLRPAGLAINTGKTNLHFDSTDKLIHCERVRTSRRFSAEKLPTCFSAIVLAAAITSPPHFTPKT